MMAMMWPDEITNDSLKLRTIMIVITHGRDFSFCGFFVSYSIKAAKLYKNSKNCSIAELARIFNEFNL